MYADHIIDLHLFHAVAYYTVPNVTGNVKIKQSCVTSKRLMNSTIYTITVRTSSPRATIANLRVNKYSHWTKCVFSAVQGRIWLKLELIQDVMVVLVSSKNEEDPISKLKALEWPQYKILIFQSLKGS